MDTLLYILAGAVGIAVGAFGGFLAGRAARRFGVWLTWVLGAAVLLAGVALGAYGQMARMWPLWSGSMGLIAGGLTGLKYGRGDVFGRSHPTAVEESREPAPVVFSQADPDADAGSGVTHR